MLHVLIADDARDVAETVAFGARMNWPDCQVTIAADGADALRYFAETWFELVVLDVAMPPPDGFEVCRRIRESSQVPILMLTVRDGTLDKVRALDLGADDYLTKPFEHLELLARMRALVRRLHLDSPVSRADFSAGDLSVNRASQEVRVGDKAIALTPIEYNLLNELISHAGSVLPHQFLLRRIWGREYEHESHYLKEYIHRLRHKLGDDAESPRFIETERGAGYRFVPGRPS
jgi:two-component system KDP operon response regulator KdpE